MNRGEGEGPVSAAGPGAAAEDRRRAAGALVLGVYRLIKACLLHSDSNQVVLSLVPATADAIVELCALSSVEVVTVSFGGETVFVNGQMLRTAREAYDVARELNGFFEVCGVNQLILDKGVRRADLAAFARLLADAQRDKGVATRVAGCELRGIRVRNVPPAVAGAAREERSAAARVGRAYAASILIVRALHAGRKAGETALPQRVLRIAQRLVSLAEKDLRLLLSLATARTAAQDEAGTTVAAAILALGTAQQLTADRRTLAALVSAGLLFGAGRPRITGITRAEGRGAAAPGRAGRGAPAMTPVIARALNDDDRERLPASAAVALTALGKLHLPAIARTTIVYEALALRAGLRRGPVYGGRRPPTLLARILAVAHAFAELRATPLAGVAGVQDGTIDGAIRHLTDRAGGATERTLVKLLAAALGLFPSGSLVELSTGELAVVTVAGDAPARFARPRVRVLRDPHGDLLAAPFDVDLAAPPADGVARSIARPLDAEAHQVKAIRAAVAGVLAAKPPAAASRGDPPRAASRVTEVPRRPDRVRTSPVVLDAQRALPPPVPVAAAWLGRPLSPSGLHAIVPPPHAAQARRPLVDRAALLEKIRDVHLASTQPPPPDVFASPAVPPPPRLPRESSYPAPRPTDGRSPELRSGYPIRRVDRRKEPDEEAWTDDLDTIQPRPWASLPPVRIEDSAIDPSEGWPDLDDLRMLDGSVAPLPAPEPTQEALAIPSTRRDPRLEPEEDDESWGSLPAPELPPAPESLLERDRLLAAYLAELPPTSSSRAPTSSSRAPTSSSRAPTSSSPAPTEPRRTSRALIPREEPADDTLELGPPTEPEDRP